MPKRKTAEASIEMAAIVATPKKVVKAATVSNTSPATHKRTVTKKAKQPSATATPATSPVVDTVAEPVVAHAVVPETAVTTPSVAVATPARPTSAAIAERAFFYFVERGYQHGDPAADWFRAERELMALAR